MPRLNTTQFAKHIGVSQAVMRRAVLRGRIQVGADGLIDTDTQTARWHETRDPTKGNGGRPLSAGTTAASQEATNSFNKLKTAKVALEVQILQEELKKLREETVNKEEIRRSLTAFSRLIRAKFENFPNRYGAQIAAENGCEPRGIMASIDKYLREQLIEIATVTPPAV